MEFARVDYEESRAKIARDVQRGLGVAPNDGLTWTPEFTKQFLAIMHSYPTVALSIVAQGALPHAVAFELAMRSVGAPLNAENAPLWYLAACDLLHAHGLIVYAACVEQMTKLDSVQSPALYADWHATLRSHAIDAGVVDLSTPGLKERLDVVRRNLTRAFDSAFDKSTDAAAHRLAQTLDEFAAVGVDRSIEWLPLRACRLLLERAREVVVKRAGVDMMPALARVKYVTPERMHAALHVFIKHEAVREGPSLDTRIGQCRERLRGARLIADHGDFREEFEQLLAQDDLDRPGKLKGLVRAYAVAKEVA